MTNLCAAVRRSAFSNPVPSCSTSRKKPIADIISYPWTVNWQGQDQDLAEFPYFKRWFDELSERPAVQRGLAIGKDFANDAVPASPEEAERRAKLLYNQRARPVQLA